MKSDLTKQNEAVQRQQERAKRTPAEQLKLIKSRRGESKRETARLQAQIELAKLVKQVKSK